MDTREYDDSGRFPNLPPSRHCGSTDPERGTQKNKSSSDLVRPEGVYTTDVKIISRTKELISSLQRVTVKTVQGNHFRPGFRSEFPHLFMLSGELPFSSLPCTMIPKVWSGINIISISEISYSLLYHYFDT